MKAILFSAVAAMSHEREILVLDAAVVKETDAAKVERELQFVSMEMWSRASQEMASEAQES